MLRSSLKIVGPSLLCLLAVLRVGASQDPIYRGGTDLVVADCLVTDKTGRPIRDLRADELRLTIDGRVRAIRSLELVGQSSLSGRRVSGAGPTASPAPQAPSPITAGRTFFLTVGHIKPEVGLIPIQAAERFLATLGPQDRVGVATFPGGLVTVEPTTTFARVRDELARSIGFYNTHINGGDSWEEFLDRMTAIPGMKTVVFISEQGPPDVEIRGIARAASRAHARVYVIQPLHFQGAASNPGSDGKRAYVLPDLKLQNLASATGGAYFHPFGKVEPVFEQILLETENFYLIGFEPTAAERDGKTHNISVKIARAGVDVRVRPFFSVQPTRRTPTSR